VTRDQANRWLAAQGFPALQVNKAEGVWYMTGAEDDDRIDQSVERCLHVVRTADLTEEALRWKLEELTRPLRATEPCEERTALPSTPAGVEGVRRYLAARDAKPMRGMDPEVIHAIHAGTEWEADLRVSDLRALAQQPAAETVTVQEAWEWAGGNPGIKATRADLEAALRDLDAVCDAADQPPAVVDGATLEKIALLFTRSGTYFLNDRKECMKKARKAVALAANPGSAP